MVRLIEEVPEAQSFIGSVLDNLDDYQLFGTEEFEAVYARVLATTSVDRHGDQLSLEALESLVRQIQGGTCWQHYHHDPFVQPVGRILAGRLFYSSRSAVHFVAVVHGVYCSNTIRTFKNVGVELSAPGETEGLVQAVAALPGEVQIEASPIEFPSASIHALVAGSPLLVSKKAVQSFRKALIPEISILTIILPALGALWNPFSRAFLERLGTEAAERLIEFLTWVKRESPKILATGVANRRVLEIATLDQGCKVRFIVEYRNPKDIETAVDLLPVAAEGARSLLRELRRLNPEIFVYEFDAEKRLWLPGHAATRGAGVISDRPRPFDVSRMRGLSIAGTVVESESAEELDDRGEDPPEAGGDRL